MIVLLQVQLMPYVGRGKTNLDHTHKPINLPAISKERSRQLPYQPRLQFSREVIKRSNIKLPRSYKSFQSPGAINSSLPVITINARKN